jgi:hypothetical protein
MGQRNLHTSWNHFIILITATNLPSQGFEPMVKGQHPISQIGTEEELEYVPQHFCLGYKTTIPIGNVDY